MIDITKYLGLRYDINSVHGVNCWTLVVMIYKDAFNLDLSVYAGDTNSKKDIANQFIVRLGEMDFGFAPVDTPKDGDLVIFEIMDASTVTFHCGVYYKKKIIHANGSGRKGSVWYDRLIDIKNNKVRFLRYAID